MAAALETSVAGKSIGTRPVTVRNRRDLQELHLCSVIYIGQAEKKVAPWVAKSVAGKQILTVSEFPKLGSEGVAISFFFDQERVRFEVHLGRQPGWFEDQFQAVTACAYHGRQEIIEIAWSHSAVSLSVADSPDRISSVIGDQQRAGAIYCKADWAAVGASGLLIGQEAREEVLHRHRWTPVPERHKDHFVSGELITVPGTVLADKCAAAISLGKRISPVKGK